MICLAPIASWLARWRYLAIDLVCRWHKSGRETGDKRSCINQLGPFDRLPAAKAQYGPTPGATGHWGREQKGLVSRIRESVKEKHQVSGAARAKSGAIMSKQAGTSQNEPELVS